MFLLGVSDIVIRQIGRWSSLAFLEYIGEQVESFTYEVLQKMLNANQLEQEVQSPNNPQSKENGSNHVPFTVYYSGIVISERIGDSDKRSSENRVRNGGR